MFRHDHHLLSPESVHGFHGVAHFDGVGQDVVVKQQHADDMVRM